VGNSLHDVFLLAAPIALAGFLIVLALRDKPLRGREQGQPEPAARPEAPAAQRSIAV
jgi:hypothetical protein